MLPQWVRTYYLSNQNCTEGDAFIDESRVDQYEGLDDWGSSGSENFQNYFLEDVVVVLAEDLVE